jgi:hypothetical protein
MSGEEQGIDAAKVDTAFRASLYREPELRDLPEGRPPEDAILVEGITGRYGFHPARLEGQRASVTAWLKALPHTFRKNEGGGWSFLQACYQQDGVQWGEHRNMEQLFCLGIGLGLAECQVPRELWSALPGGMPYYVLLIEAQEPAS